MRIKELLEGRHGYDSYGYSLAPGHDEGEPVYNPDYDVAGDGGPPGYRHRQHHIDVPHDVHIDGRKWKTFSSKSHAENVARKLSAKGKKVHIRPASEGMSESATAGATSAANIGTVVSPQLSPGKARGKKSYTGSMATGSGTKAPPQPVVKQPKNSDGTAKNGLDIKGNIFGGPAVKR